MYRLFLAIDLPDRIKSRINSICTGLDGVKWENEDQIHLTLRFIGDTDARMVDDIIVSLLEFRGKSFPLELNGLGHFSSKGNPKVIWAGVVESRELLHLYKKVNTNLIQCGVDQEHRKFAPHITLCRVKKCSSSRIADYLSYYGLFRTEPFVVSQFHLYSSKLTQKGAIHEKLKSFDLS